MFERTASLPVYRIFGKKFLIDLSRKLAEADFQSPVIQIPLGSETEGKEDISFSIEEFFRKNINYGSIILTAKSNSNEEEIKILFVNRQADLHFLDSIFPSSKGKSTTLYVESNNPVRCESLFNHFYRYISKSGINISALSVLLPFIILITLYIDITLLLHHSSGLIFLLLGSIKFLDNEVLLLIEILFIFLLISIFFIEFKRPIWGLYINRKPFLQYKNLYRNLRKALLWLASIFLGALLSYYINIWIR